MRYRVNAPSVAYEVFDDQTVVLNLEQGAYYSFNDSASALWQFLMAGESTQTLPAAVIGCFKAEPGMNQMTDDVKAFIQSLLDHGLVVPDDTANPRDIPYPAMVQLAWSTPAIAVYDDMRDLLAMDPPLPIVLDTDGDA